VVGRPVGRWRPVAACGARAGAVAAAGHGPGAGRSTRARTRPSAGYGPLGLGAGIRRRRRHPATLVRRGPPEAVIGVGSRATPAGLVTGLVVEATRRAPRRGRAPARRSLIIRQAQSRPVLPAPRRLLGQGRQIRRVRYMETQNLTARRRPGQHPWWRALPAVEPTV